MKKYKRPKALKVLEEECVCHQIKVIAPGRAMAEVRVIVHTTDGRTFDAVVDVELEEN